MIWLPGILSQGGRKYTWGRYSFAYDVQRTFEKSVNHSSSGSSSFSAYSAYSLDATTGKLKLTNSKTFSYGTSFGTVYSASASGFGGSSAISYDTIYELKCTSAGYDVVGDPTFSWDSYKITAVKVLGDLIDTVDSSDPDAYPENGISGNYWYVKYSDTPITWERYATSEGEAQGESVTQTATSSTYFYRATSYSRSGKTFTATGTRTRASSLAVGNYLIQNNGAFVNSTSLSGDTLFKITKKSGSSTVSLTFDTYTVGDVKGNYIDTVTSYNPYEYPDDGAQDGYWYVRVETGSVSNGIATFVIQNFDSNGATVTATCPVGTTWAEFIESDDNTISLYIGSLGDEEYVCPRTGGFICVGDSSANAVRPSDIIDPTLYYRVY